MATRMRPREPEPARESYWFGPGWRQFGQFLQNMWRAVGDSIRDCYLNYVRKSIFTFRGIGWFLTALAVAIFGSIYTAFISVLFIVVLAIFYVIIYLCFTFVWLIDRAHLHRNKIFTACPRCKARSLIPYYQCPRCHKLHKNLVPGKYGIFHRTCECGEVFGSSFLTGRKNLQAYCPSCNCALSDRENVPICIPVVGGRSAGKTAFITAFAKGFLDEVAPEHEWTTEFYDEEKEQIYDEIRSDYNHGTTRITRTANGRNDISSISFSFFLSGKDLRPERLVHIYDIAGEVFTHNAEAELQKQYEYCQGLVLMLDPFSIQDVKSEYGENLSAVDAAGISIADSVEVVDAFINKLREVTGLTNDQLFKTPIAIVISKIDSAGLMRELGPMAIKAAMREFEDQRISEMDAMDYVCRQFLARHEMRSFLSEIDGRFKVNRYFACSAIGHSRERGRYVPKGVMEPMEWLFGLADPAIGRKWKDHSYGKVPVKRK